MPGVVGTLAFLVTRRLLRLVGLGPKPDGRRRDRGTTSPTDDLAASSCPASVPAGGPAAAGRAVSAAASGAVDVVPGHVQTLLRWHRELIRRRWTYPKTGASRGLDAGLVELVVRLAEDNSRWGYQRIAGECRKLGVRVSASSVRTILRRHRLGPAPRPGGPSWASSCAAKPLAFLPATSSLSRRSR
jgi:putative transposase